jgi:hypothetical protein
MCRSSDSSALNVSASRSPIAKRLIGLAANSCRWSYMVSDQNASTGGVWPGSKCIR